MLRVSHDIETKRSQTRTMPETIAPVLQVNQLSTRFKTRSGDVHAVNNVSF